MFKANKTRWVIVYKSGTIRIVDNETQAKIEALQYPESVFKIIPPVFRD